MNKIRSKRWIRAIPANTGSWGGAGRSSMKSRRTRETFLLVKSFSTETFRWGPSPTLTISESWLRHRLRYHLLENCILIRCSLVLRRIERKIQRASQRLSRLYLGRVFHEAKVQLHPDQKRRNDIGQLHGVEYGQTHRKRWRRRLSYAYEFRFYCSPQRNLCYTKQTLATNIFQIRAYRASVTIPYNNSWDIKPYWSSMIVLYTAECVNIL